MSRCHHNVGESPKNALSWVSLISPKEMAQVILLADLSDSHMSQ
jgi:hypothetical protein